MKRLERIAAAVALTAAAALPEGQLHSQDRPQPTAIYGKDDRLDLYQAGSGPLRAMADSTVALLQESRVKVEGEAAKLQTDSYAEQYTLCPDEPFHGQRTAAFCSGSLVGPDLVMTAGHCLRAEEACKGTRFVFGFSVTREGASPESVPAGEVYGCAQLVGRQEEAQGPDWALVRLDRPVAGHAPLAFNRSGAIANGAKLVVIGHPAGLPTKIAGGASVRDASPEGYFVANLDTYGGNSGSAVFNAESGLIEGVLVRGESDYVWRDGCRVSNRCADDACRGEDVTKASALADRVPSTDPPAAGAAARSKRREAAISGVRELSRRLGASPSLFDRRR